jgi:hypothetical protein
MILTRNGRGDLQQEGTRTGVEALGRGNGRVQEGTPLEENANPDSTSAPPIELGLPGRIAVGAEINRNHCWRGREDF